MDGLFFFEESFLVVQIEGIQIEGESSGENWGKTKVKLDLQGRNGGMKVRGRWRGSWSMRGKSGS